MARVGSDFFFIESDGLEQEQRPRARVTGTSKNSSHARGARMRPNYLVEPRMTPEMIHFCAKTYTSIMGAIAIR